jgi:hypothetical protein
MPALQAQFQLDRCPHCSVDKPSLNTVHSFKTVSHTGDNLRFWRIYVCRRCGGALVAGSDREDGWADEYYPSTTQIDEAVPEPAKSYLQQALDSLHSPAGSIMLSASSVDSMLKEKGYLDGSLHARINRAAEDHVITSQMAQWAHQVRLDANAQRHADQQPQLPSPVDARQTLDFAIALSEFMFVLPSRITQGVETSAQNAA